MTASRTQKKTSTALLRFLFSQLPSTQEEPARSGRLFLLWALLLNLLSTFSVSTEDKPTMGSIQFRNRNNGQPTPTKPAVPDVAEDDEEGYGEEEIAEMEADGVLAPDAEDAEFEEIEISVELMEEIRKLYLKRSMQFEFAIDLAPLLAPGAPKMDGENLYQFCLVQAETELTAQNPWLAAQVAKQVTPAEWKIVFEDGKLIARLYLQTVGRGLIRSVAETLIGLVTEEIQLAEHNYDRILAEALFLLQYLDAEANNDTGN